VKRWIAAAIARRPPNTSAPPSNPRPVVVATKSPSAVPSVFETRMATR
jgi:hypothetical protein